MIWCSTNFWEAIQVVPGRAGGGSFSREKELYSKERICLKNVHKVTDQRDAKNIFCCERAFCRSMAVMSCALKIHFSKEGSGDVVVTSFDAM